MPLDVTTFKNQIEAYESGFHQTIIVNGQAGYRNLWGEIVPLSSLDTTSTVESADAAVESAGSRALHDGKGRYVNANFNDIKRQDNESPYTEYKGLTFFPFEFFDVSKAPRDKQISSEMRGKAAGFTVLGSISVTDPDMAFTPVSFDISSPNLDKDGYLYSMIVGFQYDSMSLIMQVLEAIVGFDTSGLADHKSGPSDTSVSIPVVNAFIPSFNIPPSSKPTSPP
jgi:hypothetical protein